MDIGVVVIFWVAIIGIGQLVRYTKGVKVFYIAHIIGVLIAFLSGYGYSFTMQYQAQALPWIYFSLANTLSIWVSVLIGVFQDVYHKVKDNKTM